MINSLKLLVLEDAEAHQELIKRSLELIGIKHIEFAQTIGEFFDTLEQRGKDFNSFIVDVHLGEGQMDGVQVLKLARSLGFAYPAAVITMDTSLVDLMKCYELGVTAIFEKDRLYEEDALISLARGLAEKYICDKLHDSKVMIVPVVNEEISYIPASDILFIQFSEGTYTIHTYCNSYETTLPIKLYARLLESFDFYPVSKSALVNLKAVERIDVIEQCVTFYHDPENRSIPVQKTSVSSINKYIKNRMK
ncbi:LytTR family DNA-binding domain-containing protein [Brevibacillus sp. HD3.3A]|uniref:LytTR family DNA-binding domain-containing protein n=1 Tax=Brevibacillus sp. HD3.3A TaxID=2738979 RepID=UPI00156A895C|nr:LytTR family DNA-binding domain-containing protein [Brevibacillus sp. HD3.3A]UED72103.1 LytTR family transcriptional regulator DNA-binding domain-containing protein [Brevibacillus sp. HD3.3A]